MKRELIHDRAEGRAEGYGALIVRAVLVVYAIAALLQGATGIVA